VVAVAGDPHERSTFYFGSSGGGIWKSVDAGVYWENVSDGFFRRASVGAIAVASSDPNVIYAGMGESCIRGNVSHGDGVWRSTDAGRTWSHVGLADTRHIGRVRIDPRDPDRVYTAALGHVHGPNQMRGLFRSKDGGARWERVLFRGAGAGAVDLALDEANPRTLYAAFWQAIRTPWGLTSGGTGSGLFRSTDGGDSWIALSRNPGFPSGILGRIGVAASPARSGRVWAIVEAEAGGLFRSDDGGDHWERMSEDRALRQRPWYYQHVVADPRDHEKIYVLNVDPWRSNDGGRTFTAMAIPHGDHHDLWIDPRDPLRMIEGNDFGATVTLNGGESWSRVDNQPTGEMYHVTTDTRTPYRIYGAQQDTTTISVPSRSALAAITTSDHYAVGGGESGYVAVRPDDPDVVYAGSYQGVLTRYDRRSGQVRNIQVWPETTAGETAAEVRYRFQWTYPIVVSPHDSDTIYVGGNHVFRSVDEGMSWDRISPDLTRADPERMGSSGGPITKDNTGAEYYCTIFTLAESPVEPGVLWAGSDDGLVHVSRDGGSTWTQVTPRGLAPWSLISIIEPSPHRAGTAYLAVTRYKLDDPRPYLFATDDFGRSWRRIVRGIPSDDFTRVIREDPEHEGLLFAGTETGAYTSLDRGRTWRRLGGLPAVPVHDLVLRENDLILATHGRSFWILDDVSFLRELARAEASAIHLFTPRTTTRYRSADGFPRAPRPSKNYRVLEHAMVTFRLVEQPTGERGRRYLDAGANAADAVIVDYWLRDAADAVELSFLDGHGGLIRSFRSDAGPPRPTGNPGLNRFWWNMRYPDAARITGVVPWDERSVLGPLAVPGRYSVRLRVGGAEQTVSFDIIKDPRIGADASGLADQFALHLQIRDKISETHHAIDSIRRTRNEMSAWQDRVGSGRESRAAAAAARRLLASLLAIEERLIQTKAKTRQDMLNFPARLDAKLGGLALVVGGADHPPSAGMRAVFADLAARVDRELAVLDRLLRIQAQRFDALARRAGSPVISTPIAIVSDRVRRPAKHPRPHRSVSRRTDRKG